MPINLKEGDRYVVNYGEGLTAVDFGGHVSLAEKEGVGMVERRSGTGHAEIVYPCIPDPDGEDEGARGWKRKRTVVATTAWAVGTNESSDISRMRQRDEAARTTYDDADRERRALMVAAIDAGCCDWGDGKKVRLLMEEKAAGCSSRGEGGGIV
ncbi:hypothetical protein GW17_00042153 [Ensete ventricosum]|nr:hypothetical protein GW17_00042153 [Ensete ventricosum]